MHCLQSSARIRASPRARPETVRAESGPCAQPPLRPQTGRANAKFSIFIGTRACSRLGQQSCFLPELEPIFLVCFSAVVPGAAVKRKDN